MSTIRGIVLPNDYFLVKDKDGYYHWFAKDPLRNKDKKAIEVNIEDAIAQAVGVGTVANPVIVHLNCAKVDRSVSFNIGLLSSVRRGDEAKHFEDMEGNIVDVLEIQNSDTAFPLSGAVFNEKGDVIEIRKYSFKGACSDGVDEHHLMAINGMAELGGKKKE